MSDVAAVRARRRTPLAPEIPTDVRILTIAADHVRRFGAPHTTVTAVARAAAMSHANIYRYYPSKAALFDEITADWLKPIETGLRDIADGPDPTFDKFERIVLAIHRAYRAKAETDPQIFALFCDAAERDAALVRKHRNRCQVALRRTLEEGGAGGRMDIADQGRALVLIGDALHRFTDPIAVRLDLRLPRQALESRAARVGLVILRALASGRY